MSTKALNKQICRTNLRGGARHNIHRRPKPRQTQEAKPVWQAINGINVPAKPLKFEQYYTSAYCIKHNLNYNTFVKAYAEQINKKRSEYIDERDISIRRRDWHRHYRLFSQVYGFEPFVETITNEIIEQEKHPEKEYKTLQPTPGNLCALVERIIHHIISDKYNKDEILLDTNSLELFDGYYKQAAMFVAGEVDRIDKL